MYRVWDTDNKRWLDDYENVYINSNDEIFVIKKGLFGRTKLKEAPADCVIHYSTGLYDMIGAPIFEGDLLKVYFPDSKDDEEYEVGIIGYVDIMGQYGVFINENETWYPLSQGACNDMTLVCGNCFEGRWDEGEE